MLIVDVQIADDVTQELPSSEDFTIWAQAAYFQEKESRLSLRIVGSEESRQLNKAFRDQDKPTNVLSFPMQMPDEIQPSILGDIAICAEVVIDEALEQKKIASGHWAHMVVHGMLHLQGYDHLEDKEAQQMESLEVKILTEMGIKNPYSS